MKQKIYIEISGDILREKKHKQKTKVRTHSGDEKKWLDYIDEKQKIYIEISGDILKEKKHKQKTKVRTHSGDENKAGYTAT